MVSCLRKTGNGGNWWSPWSRRPGPLNIQKFATATLRRFCVSLRLKRRTSLNGCGSFWRRWRLLKVTAKMVTRPRELVPRKRGRQRGPPVPVRPLTESRCPMSISPGPLNIPLSHSPTWRWWKKSNPWCGNFWRSLRQRLLHLLWVLPSEVEGCFYASTSGTEPAPLSCLRRNGGTRLP
jgi:hypothetical protein